MSDIRLNTLKYTALPNDDDTTRSPMPASVRVAASASATRLAKKPGRRQDRYTDDPEEQAGLLGDQAYDEEEEQAYEAQERRLETEVETVRV